MYFCCEEIVFTTPESHTFDRATQERQLALEREMYKHICKLCDDVNPDNIADIFRSMRMAKQFEEVRTIEMEELSKISLSCLAAQLLMKSQIAGDGRCAAMSR